MINCMCLQEAYSAARPEFIEVDVNACLEKLVNLIHLRRRALMKVPVRLPTHAAVSFLRMIRGVLARTARKMPIAVPLSSNLYISPMTPAPMEKPGEEPAAWKKRKKKSSLTDLERLTPTDPKMRSGSAQR